MSRMPDQLKCPRCVEVTYEYYIHGLPSRLAFVRVVPYDLRQEPNAQHVEAWAFAAQAHTTVDCSGQECGDDFAWPSSVVRTRWEERRGVCHRHSRWECFWQGQLDFYPPCSTALNAWIRRTHELFQTSVARAILSALNYVPTVLILSQDSFYNQHTPEEVESAFKNELDLGESLAGMAAVLASVQLI